MATSDPSIVSAPIPGEAQPNNRFTIDVEIAQAGPDPLGNDGGCVSQNLDIAGWVTPVKLYVDGEIVDEKELCLASGNRKTAKLSMSLPQGTHDVEITVFDAGGSAYDFSNRENQPSDTRRQTVTVSRDARDPSTPTTTDQLTRFLQRIADALGGTTQQVAFGAALAVVLLLVV